MPDVSTTVTILAPRDRLIAYAADPANAPAWYSHVEAGEWLTAGSKFELVARLPPGRRVTFVYDVVETTPERMTFRTDDGPLPMETSYSWSPDGNGGTVMTLRNRWDPSGLARLAAPIVTRAMRRANRRDLMRLKAILEADGA